MVRYFRGLSGPYGRLATKTKRERRRENRTGARFCCTLLLIIGILGAAGPSARAADPQAYTIEINSTGHAELDAALKASSQLESLRTAVPVGPFALILRAKDDVERLDTVLRSFGYYDGVVAISIDGHPLGDAGLADRLQAVPQQVSVSAKVEVSPGPLFHLGQVRIEGAVPEAVRDKLGLSSGQPAVASEVLAARARLLAALQEDGYALAVVDAPSARLDAKNHVVDVSFKVETGRRAAIGPIRFSGLKDVRASFIDRRLLLHVGELYQPTKIEAARRDLAALGVFSSVTVKAGHRIAADGRIPVVFTFRERPKHAVAFTGAYSTDLGGSLKTTWTDRNLFGNAERLNLSAAGNGLGGTATTGLGYDFSAQFLKPDFLRHDQSLESNLSALNQGLDAYDRRAVMGSVLLHRKLTRFWTGSLGVSGTAERIRQEGVAHTYTLLALPFVFKYDSTDVSDPLQDPTHGVRATFLATPTESLGVHNSIFTVVQASASTYLDASRFLGEAPGRSVIALRALIGNVFGATQFQLPPDQRFYAGGSATVRGFKYQSIGPLFPDGKPIGGTAIDAATVEFRQRLFGNFGAVAFVDLGQVSGNNEPFAGTLRVGTGAGLRYYTPIGPIRLDVAVPVNRPPGGDAFEIYIGLGQAF